jgi:hypothetical protein
MTLVSQITGICILRLRNDRLPKTRTWKWNLSQPQMVRSPCWSASTQTMIVGSQLQLDSWFCTSNVSATGLSHQFRRFGGLERSIRTWKKIEIPSGNDASYLKTHWTCDLRTMSWTHAAIYHDEKSNSHTTLISKIPLLLRDYWLVTFVSSWRGLNASFEFV